jgi:hypothetical protein
MKQISRELDCLVNKSTEIKKQDPTTKLGDVIKQFVESNIEPKHKKSSPLMELWNKILPEEQRRHCKIDSISGGLMKVKVDSPSYLSELQWSSGDLLAKIKEQCPAARIKKIKFTVG